MDRQSSQNELQGLSKADAAKRLKCAERQLSYYAWPQLYGSTAGPFGGMGGQAMTTFTLEAWHDGRNAVIFCQGKYLKTVELFDPPVVRIS